MEQTQGLVLSIRDVEAAEPIDTGYTLALHLEGTCGRQIVLILPVRAGARLVQVASQTLERAARGRTVRKKPGGAEA